MRKIALSEVKDDLSRYLRVAEKEAVVITRHGKPAGVLVGFATEEEWFEYRLQNDPRFLLRIESARASLRGGAGIRLEDLEVEAAPVPRRKGGTRVSRKHLAAEPARTPRVRRTN
ncbi:MAG: type II toxin-antitoxin system Phd/YefM family antitoxin [Deltaproteobacteria bacterium]|nr:type II toxin-antitoxin system Phd/YefM family antitoxin [Deltaproteobacteria bacterium]